MLFVPDIPMLRYGMASDLITIIALSDTGLLGGRYNCYPTFLLIDAIEFKAEEGGLSKPYPLAQAGVGSTRLNKSEHLPLLCIVCLRSSYHLHYSFISLYWK